MTQRAVSSAVQELLESVSNAEDIESVLPVSASVAMENRKKEAARQARIAVELNGREEPLHLIGELIRDQGVFVGRYIQNDKAAGLLRAFNIFAAPQDLTDDAGQEQTYTYKEAVARVAGLQSWKGHDGTHYKNAKKFYKALKDGSYKGGWIVPPGEIIVRVLHAKDAGALNDTFMKAAANHDSFPPRYPWNYLTSSVREEDGVISTLNFRSRSYGFDDKDGNRSSCRPVRLVPVGQP
jgi:hypothetical protein